MASKRAIDSFLSCRRVALVGVSRQPKDFSRMVLDALVKRGYDVVPVNQNGGEIGGRACARSVPEIAPPVDGALLLTPPSASAAVVRACAQAGVGRVWLHRGAGKGAVSAEAVALCREHGIEVVDGACPLMFLAGTGLGHRVHGFFHRLAGGVEA